MSAISPDQVDENAGAAVIEAFKDVMPKVEPFGQVEKRPEGPQIFIASPGVELRKGWRVGIVWKGGGENELIAHHRLMKVVSARADGKIVLKSTKELRK